MKPDRSGKEFYLTAKHAGLNTDLKNTLKLLLFKVLLKRKDSSFRTVAMSQYFISTLIIAINTQIFRV